MSFRPISRLFLSALRPAGVWAVALGLLAPAAPVHASEVVKLARLVITGKRQPSKPSAAPPAVPAERGGAESIGPQSRSSDVDSHASTGRRGAEATMSMGD